MSACDEDHPWHEDAEELFYVCATCGGGFFAPPLAFVGMKMALDFHPREAVRPVCGDCYQHIKKYERK